MHAQISFQKRVTNNVASKLRNGALLSPSQRTANVIQTSHKEIKKSICHMWLTDREREMCPKMTENGELLRLKCVIIGT